MYMYVYIYVCIYIYICTYIYIHIYMYIHTYLHVYIYTYIHICVYVCMYIYSFKHSYINLCLCLCLRFYVCFSLCLRHCFHMTPSLSLSHTHTFFLSLSIAVCIFVSVSVCVFISVFISIPVYFACLPFQRQKITTSARLLCFSYFLFSSFCPSTLRAYSHFDAKNINCPTLQRHPHPSWHHLPITYQHTPWHDTIHDNMRTLHAMRGGRGDCLFIQMRTTSVHYDHTP